MEELSREEFLRQKADATERIKEIYRGHTMPPYPDFISVPQNPKSHQNQFPVSSHQSTPTHSSSPIKHTATKNSFIPSNIFRILNIPELLKSQDTLLILGLIFLLMSDNSDEKLILALVFIML